MMYQIWFNYRRGVWEIRFLVWHLFWVSVHKANSVNKWFFGVPRREKLQFDTFDQAVAYVKQTGINQAYDRKPTVGYSSAIEIKPTRSGEPILVR